MDIKRVLYKFELTGRLGWFPRGRTIIKCILVHLQPEGKSPLGRPGHRWEDNIRMDLGGKALTACTGLG
jgi:hypothetical protein